MSKVHEARLKLRGELEAPPALRRFGSGWVSGVLGLVLGLAGFSLVLALRFPGVFATPEMGGLYSNPWFRVGLHFVLLAAFVLSAISLALRPGKILGTCGVAATLLAAMLGGSSATTVVADKTPLYIGLDFFVLRVLFTGLLFIPLERIFAQRSEQHVFREEWREDLFYYLVSSLLVQLLTFLTFIPAKSILVLTPMTELRAWVGGAAVRGAIHSDHVPYGLRAILGAPGVSSHPVVVAVSRGASFSAQHGLDGRSADALFGDSRIAQFDGDPDVRARV